MCVVFSCSLCGSLLFSNRPLIQCVSCLSPPLDSEVYLVPLTHQHLTQCLAHSWCSISMWCLMNGCKNRWPRARVWTLPLWACLRISNDHSSKNNWSSYEKGTITPVLPLGKWSTKNVGIYPDGQREKCVILVPHIFVERVRKRRLDWRSLGLLLSSQAHGQRWVHRLQVKMWAERSMQWHCNKIVQPVSRTEIIHVLVF